MEGKNTDYIPHIIHYCWFGKGTIPENQRQYIQGWKEKLPDYQIMEWNEDNFDIETAIPYVREAYKEKKYAFVSDYVRLHALYEYGGIYLDTDVEVRKDPTKLLKGYTMVTGFETEKLLITAFIAVSKKHPIIGEFLNRYKNRRFIMEDGSYDLTTINEGFSYLLEEHGVILNNSLQVLEDGIIIYPYVYFCGIDIENSHPRITEDTYTIHHFQSSWKKMDFKTMIKYKVIVRFLQGILGYDRYDALKKKLHI